MCGSSPVERNLTVSVQLIQIWDWLKTVWKKKKTWILENLQAIIFLILYILRSKNIYLFSENIYWTVKIFTIFLFFV